MKTCPFCNSDPIFPKAEETHGTCYDCGCQECGIATISIQIIDCFDYPRDHVHNSWDNDKSKYSNEIIEVAIKEAVNMWETRLGC